MPVREAQVGVEFQDERLDELAPIQTVEESQFGFDVIRRDIAMPRPRFAIVARGPPVAARSHFVFKVEWETEGLDAHARTLGRFEQFCQGSSARPGEGLFEDLQQSVRVVYATVGLVEKAEPSCQVR